MLFVVLLFIIVVQPIPVRPTHSVLSINIVAQIEVLEQRAAATGDLRRIARPQQWKSLKGPKHATAAGDASGASEDLFYVDAAGGRCEHIAGRVGSMCILF